MKNRVQTNPRSAKLTASDPAKAGPAKWRFGLYAVGAVLVVLSLAYIDGGEEPLHPIVQSVSLQSTVEQSS